MNKKKLLKKILSAFTISTFVMGIASPLYNYSTKDRMFYRLKIRTKASTSTSKKKNDLN